MRNWLLLLALVAGATCTGAPVSDLSFSPDGSVLASTGHREVVLLSPSDASRIGEIKCEFPRVTGLSFHPDGRTLAISGGTPGEKGLAVLVNWKSKEILRRLPDFKDLVTSIEISPNGSSLALASADTRAAIFSLTNDTAPPIDLTGHSAAVLSITFSPSNEIALTTSADRSIKVWSASDGRLLRSFSHHTEMVHELAFRPRAGSDIIECASASEDQTVRIWQPAIGRMVRIIRGHDEPIFAVAYTPDGSALFSAGKSGIIRQIQIGSDEILNQWQAHPEPIYSITVSPDNSAIASGDWAGNVKLWKIAASGSKQ